MGPIFALVPHPALLPLCVSLSDWEVLEVSAVRVPSEFLVPATEAALGGGTGKGLWRKGLMPSPSAGSR